MRVEALSGTGSGGVFAPVRKGESGMIDALLAWLEGLLAGTSGEGTQEEAAGFPSPGG